MKCYVLEQGQKFDSNMPKAEISAELEQKVAEYLSDASSRFLGRQHSSHK